MKYSVQIINKASKRVVETIPCHSESDARSIVQGVRVNLNHAEFKAEIVEGSPCINCAICVKSDHIHKQE